MRYLRLDCCKSLGWQNIKLSTSNKILLFPQAQIGNYVSVRHNNRYYTADKNVTCRNCDKRGHLSKNCPTPKVNVVFQFVLLLADDFQTLKCWSEIVLLAGILRKEKRKEKNFHILNCSGSLDPRNISC